MGMRAQWVPALMLAPGMCGISWSRYAADNPLPADDWTTAWDCRQIPRSDFADVDLVAVRRLIIDVGDRDHPSPGSAGIIVDDTYRTRPAPTQ